MTLALTIVIPFHNAANFVNKALAGLSGLDAEAEIIAIDDHSIDGTLDRLQEWVGRLRNLRVLQATDHGVAAARNQCVEAADGRYIWFIDCDDTWDLAVLREALAVAENTGADVIIANATVAVGDDGPVDVIEDASVEELIDGETAVRRLLRGEIQGHLWNKLFSRTVAISAPFPPTRAHSDLGGMFTLLGKAQEVALLTTVLYRYVLRSGSITNTSAYRWQDLPDCLSIARDTVASLRDPEAAHADLNLFTLLKVVIPLENETVRRAMWESKEQLSVVRHANRKRITSQGIAGLVRMRETKSSIQCVLIAFLPSLYRVLYNRHRGRTWAMLDIAGGRS